MRAYKVTAPAIADTDTATIVYTGTGAESREARQVFVDTLHVRKKDVTIEEIEIPTAKADFLAWVNAALQGAE